MSQTLAAKRAADPENRLADLLDQGRYARSFLVGTNWSGLADIDQMIKTLPNTVAIAALLSEFKDERLADGEESQTLRGGAQIVRIETSRRWRDSECANGVRRMVA